MTLEQLLDHAAGYAVDCFNTTGEVHPMWLVESKRFTTTIPVVPEPWTSELEKHRTYQALRRLFGQIDVDRYACMNEAWTVAFTDPKQMESWRRGASLSTHADRREIVSIVAADHTRSIQRHYFILRPEHGKPTLRRCEQDFAGEAAKSGDLASLLCRG